MHLTIYDAYGIGLTIVAIVALAVSIRNMP